MIYCFLADGFEEMEAIVPIDILRRAGIDVITVGVTGVNVTGSHNIIVKADITLSEVILDESLEGVILPGGLHGATNLENSDAVQKAIDFAYNKERLLCAICAAPQILGHKGILEGKEAIAYPGFEKELKGAIVSDKHVVRDGSIITAKGAGVAVEFGLEIVSALFGKEKSDSVRTSIQMI